jgi:hypothetical protein
MHFEIKENYNNSYLINFKNFLIFINFFLSAFQLYFYSFEINLFLTIVLINLISIFNLNITIKKINIYYYFIPSLIILFINFYYLIFPLYIKTFLGQKLLGNLEIGSTSFYISSTYVLISTLSFIFFKKITNYENKINLNRNLITKLKIFVYPNLNTTLFIFLLLLIIKLYLAIYQNSFYAHQEFGNIIVKFLFGLERLFYLPIVYIFYLFFFRKQISGNKFILFLSLNFILSFLFAIITNNRTEIFELFTIVFFCFLTIFLQGKFTINKKKFFLIFFSLIIFLILVENISKKILEFRSIKYNVTPIELLKISSGYSDFNQELVAEENRKNSRYIYTGFNILDRFTPIKHLDKSLKDSTFFSYDQIDEFKKFSYFKMLTFLPENLINIFNTNYIKLEYHLAIGSKIEQLAYNRFGGRFNKGSFITELLLVTNSYFLTFFIVFILILILLFWVSLFVKIQDNKIIFSPLIFMLIFKAIYLTQADNITTFITFFIRQLFEIFFLLNILLLFYKNKKT